MNIALFCRILRVGKYVKTLVFTSVLFCFGEFTFGFCFQSEQISTVEREKDPADVLEVEKVSVAEAIEKNDFVTFNVTTTGQVFQLEMPEQVAGFGYQIAIRIVDHTGRRFSELNGKVSCSCIGVTEIVRAEEESQSTFHSKIKTKATEKGFYQTIFFWGLREGSLKTEPVFRVNVIAKTKPAVSIAQHRFVRSKLQNNRFQILCETSESFVEFDKEDVSLGSDVVRILGIENARTRLKIEFEVNEEKMIGIHDSCVQIPIAIPILSSAQSTKESPKVDQLMYRDVIDLINDDEILEVSPNFVRIKLNDNQLAARVIIRDRRNVLDDQIGNIDAELYSGDTSNSLEVCRFEMSKRHLAKDRVVLELKAVSPKRMDPRGKYFVRFFSEKDSIKLDVVATIENDN
jgi:hypothetical protein